MNLPRGALVTVLPIPLRLKLIDFAQQPQLQPPGWNPSMLILLPRVFAQPTPKATEVLRCGELTRCARFCCKSHRGEAV